MVNQLFHDVHEAPGAGQAGMHVKRHLVAPSRMSEKYAGISGECMRVDLRSRARSGPARPARSAQLRQLVHVRGGREIAR